MFLLFAILCFILNVFYCLQLNVSEFKIKFQQFLSIEPEIGVANEYVMMMIVIDDFYLLHFQLRLKLFGSAL